jgi:hypothetical protein
MMNKTKQTKTPKEFDDMLRVVDSRALKAYSDGVGTNRQRSRKAKYKKESK